MFVIAKKKDYYDGVAGTTGIDKTIVYDRQIIELENDTLPKEFQDINPFKNPKGSPFVRLGNANIKKEFRVLYGATSYFIIGFCGKLYVGWKLYSEIKTDSYPFKGMMTTIIYDNENIKKMFEPHYWGNSFEDELNYVLTYDPMQFFRDLRTPVFLYDHDYDRKSIDMWRSHSKFIINPLLKEYQFYKVFDAVQAFQEISMFLGGVLGNKEKEIVNVADKYKITQHGFDKWSFRKEPQKK
jgi:hypothetical protein